MYPLQSSKFLQELIKLFIWDWLKIDFSKKYSKPLVEERKFTKLDLDSSLWKMKT